MLKIRVIPCLLLKGTGLVKTVQFKDPVYVGDPINAVRIFNTKGVDELILLDISAGKENPEIPYSLIAKIAEECFMPLTFGGGVQTLDDVRRILNTGVEKVSINARAFESPALIEEASRTFGSQSIIVGVDVKRHSNGAYEVFIHNGTTATGMDPIVWIKQAEKLGAGEIFLNSIDREGTGQGFDLELIRRVTAAVRIPVIVCGGAGSPEHLQQAVSQGNAAAVAAGSLFVFHGRRKAVLINFPDKEELEALRAQPPAAESE